MHISIRAVFSFLLLLVTFSANAQWQLKAVSDTFNAVTSRLDDFVFVSGNNSYLSGALPSYLSAPISSSNGTVLKNCFDATRDPLTTNVLGNQHVADFGSGAKLYRTYFGINYWFEMTSLPNMRQIEYYKDSIGYVSGLGMKKSVDKGATWSSLTLPGAVSTIVFDKLRAPGADTVFASGAKSLIRSYDGGTTWQVNLFADSITGMSFVNSTYGFVTTRNGLLYNTLDAGVSWMLMHQEPGAEFNTLVYETSGIAENMWCQ